MDINGDGALSLHELKAMLKKGNPNMTDRQIAGMFHKIDKDGNGSVNFDEFVDYLFSGHATNRTSAGRHERIAAQSAPQESVEGDWEPLLAKISAEFGGEDGIDSREFVKICQDSGLLDRKMNRNDADLIFTKVKRKGARKIDLDQLKDAVRLVAQKRAVQVQAVQAKIMEAEMTLRATQADNVRFHDDRSTYTGAHAQNEAHGRSDSPQPGGRHRRLSEQAAQAADETENETEDMWEGARETFDAFAGRNGTMENAEFAKLCQDAGLIGRGLARPDCDVMFTRFAQRRKLQWDGFQGCLRTAATKRNEPLLDVIAKVARCGGPAINATQADDVRFHDDQSTYTGAHRRSAESPPPGERHRRQAEEQAAAAGAAEDETDAMWETARDKFDAFAGRNGTMENAEFAKLCQDAGLIGRGLVKPDCDVMFSRYARSRKLEWEGFQSCLRTIATKRGEALRDIIAKLDRCDGPTVRATQADDVRFHDDQNMYTGAHRANHGVDGTARTMDSRRNSVERRVDQDSPEGDWGPCETAFEDYAQNSGCLDGKNFGDLLKFSGLIDRSFSRNQADLIFAKVKPRGMRTIEFDEFQEAVRLVAADKGMDVCDVQVAIAHNRREVRATQAAYNRFHDDEEMYTGTHVGKHR